MMTREEEILRAVLSDPALREFGNYTSLDYEDFDEALDSDNAIVSNVAKLINGDFGEIVTEQDVQKTYSNMSVDLQNNLML